MIDPGDPYRSATCEGKRGYPYRSAAMKVVRRYRRARKSKERKPVSPFRCPYCHQWHVGRGRER